MNSNRPGGVRHEFRSRDLVGGHPVIDFVNTVTARDTVPVDRLVDYAALLEWASLADLPGVGAQDPDDDRQADAELLQCQQFREALHATLSAVVDGGQVPADAAVTIEQNWHQAASHAHLDLLSQPFTLGYGREKSISAIRYALAGAAVELLSDLPRERMHRCPGDDCGWLFLDTSKAGRRRWCDMATCGTTGKNRRRRPVTTKP